MLKVESTKAFNDLVKAFKSRKGRVLTNCFLMPDETSRLISEGKMLYGEYEGWLIFLCDREDYYGFFYYTDDEADVADVKELLSAVRDKDVYADIVSRSGRGDRLTPERLIKEGAAVSYKTYQRMQLDMKNNPEQTVSFALPEGYSLSAEYCDCEKIVALWKNALDEKSTPLPGNEELGRLASLGHLFSVLDGSGDLAAVVVLSVGGKQGLIQHLSVSPAHRRRGLADCLMKKCLLAADEEGLSVLRLWVDCENTPAVTLYDRLGYQRDGMLCEQLYMKGF